MKLNSLTSKFCLTVYWKLFFFAFWEKKKNESVRKEMKSNTILREWPKRDCSDYTQQYIDSGIIEDNRTIKEICEKFLEV